MEFTTILSSVAILGGVGLAFGTLISLAHMKLKVWEDPRIDEVTDLLPGTNCGACGQAGCRAFAEALVAGKVQPATCTVMGPGDIAEVAEYLGVEAGEANKRVARLLCAGGRDVAIQQAEYRGLQTCKAAVAVAGGGKGCAWGCLGLADCEIACDFDAIYMNALIAMNGQGGWPLNLFLTPDQKPYLGGTYFPPIPGNNQPGFGEILRQALDQYRNEKETIENRSGEILQKITEAVCRECPFCLQRGEHNPVKRLISHTSFRLRGSGWYKTDYVGRNGSSADKRAEKAEDPSEKEWVEAFVRRGGANRPSSLAINRDMVFVENRELCLASAPLAVLSEAEVRHPLLHFLFLRF